MKILVTGASGFIGSHLVDKLIQAGHEVIIFDKDDPTIKSDAEYIKGNILDLGRLVASTKGIEAIYHLAAEANVDVYFKNPIYSSETNFLGTINILESARINNIKRVLIASTDWVYGGTQTLLVDEDTYLYPPAPAHLYMSSKIANEMCAHNYQVLYGVDYTIMRFGIPFGPRARPATVHPIFLSKAINHEAIIINGSGEQFRQFIYVEDLADGCVKCLSDSAKNQIFNLNGPEKVSVKRIAETIRKFLPELNVQIEFKEAREGDFKGREVSCQKAIEKLGWKPMYGYEEAMRTYISWFKEHRPR